MVKCDFAGWATRNDLLCGDGRIIKKDAFKDNDGDTVSLVWNHDHSDPNAVLGIETKVFMHIAPSMTLSRVETPRNWFVMVM